MKIKKTINRLLNDKDNFSKDNELQQVIATHTYLTDHIAELEKYIVAAKMNYFWRNKKGIILVIRKSLINNRICRSLSCNGRVCWRSSRSIRCGI